MKKNRTLVKLELDEVEVDELVAPLVKPLVELGIGVIDATVIENTQIKVNLALAQVFEMERFFDMILNPNLHSQDELFERVIRENGWDYRLNPNFSGDKDLPSEDQFFFAVWITFPYTDMHEIIDRLAVYAVHSGIDTLED